MLDWDAAVAKGEDAGLAKADGWPKAGAVVVFWAAFAKGFAAVGVAAAGCDGWPKVDCPNAGLAAPKALFCPKALVWPKADD